jgi:CYTH domain-containing protein
MPVEIERKFLVTGEGWRAGSRPVAIVQGFLAVDPDRCAVRVRVAGERATLTVKGRAEGIRRAEFEYAIPEAQARELLKLCIPPLIEKTRHLLEFGGRIWEVDEFHGVNRGLVVAEVELPDEDAEITMPPWAGKDVSEDPRYRNTSLTRKPFTTWE